MSRADAQPAVDVGTLRRALEQLGRIHGQLVERALRRDPAHRIAGRNLGLGRQARFGAEAAREDLLAQDQVDLVVERGRQAGIDARSGGKGLGLAAGGRGHGAN